MTQKGFKAVTNTLKRYKNRPVTISTFICDDSIPLSMYSGKPTQVLAESTEEEGNILTIYFDDYSFSVSERLFKFEVCDQFLDDRPIDPCVSITLKECNDVYFLIDFE